MPTFSYEAGRTIYRDGKPFLSIARCNGAEPADVDNAARTIARVAFACDYNKPSSPYCVPWNAGLASETPAVCRRIGRLLTALDTEINSNIAQGAICDHIREFRFLLMSRLESDGWSMSYDGGNRMKVRPPGHKRPFSRRIVNPEV